MPTTRGPQPFNQFTVSTRFLRVPSTDWPAVKRGYKRQFRKAGKGAGGFGLDKIKLPTPVVLYKSDGKALVQADLGYQPEAKLAVLESVEREPLGAISEASLALEGFASLQEFRRYWIQRERRRWQPTRLVWVYTVRPWDHSDHSFFGQQLIDHLYGDFLVKEAS
jgi:hypothetical protein